MEDFLPFSSTTGHLLVVAPSTLNSKSTGFESLLTEWPFQILPQAVPNAEEAI
jgi:hypothetical protein